MLVKTKEMVGEKILGDKMQILGGKMLEEE